MIRRTSNSFAFRVNLSNQSDLEKLKELKNAVSLINKYQLDKKRAVLRGRKPTSCFDQFGNVVGGIKNATLVDVYIYDRR